MSRITLVAVGLCAVASLAPAQSRSSRDDVSRIDTTFAFDKRGTVSLSIGNGEVIVTAWNRDEVRVRARSERNTVRMDATSSRLTLELSRPGTGDTRFEVTVPVGVRITARARQGDITVSGTRGGVEASTQNGSIQVDDVGDVVDIVTLSGDISARGIVGRVDIRSTSGTVSVENAKGDVEATTISGDIILRGVSARYVRGKSTSGDIQWDGDIDGTGRYELASHSGSVYLIVPATTGAQITVATYNGSIDSEFPIVLRPGEHGVGAARRITFEIGKGDARISAESFSGDVTIRARPARPPR